jgi:hypothetical protein
MPNRTDIIVIERPDKCGTVWIAFSEYQWHPGTFDNYKKDAALRQKRMQFIRPADWIAFGSDESGHAVKASASAIERILEYNPGFDVERLQPKKPYEVTTDDNGGFDEATMNAVYTRYPIHVRQRTPIQASKQLLQVMADAGANPQGNPRPPMVLALWDGIGNVHELTGFRNDAGGMLTNYMAENAVQIDAIGCLIAAEKAVRAGAVESKSKMRSSLRAGWEAFLSSAGSGGLDGIPAQPIHTTPEENAAAERRIAEAGVISKEEAQKLGDAAWPKYEKEINRSARNTFQMRYDILQQLTLGLQADRAADVGAWLEAPVFLAALNDYNDDDICDGKAFEGVIAEAFLGLPSEATGAAIVSKYFNNMDPTDSNSLLWRAFALNQATAKIELKQLLSTAIAHRADSINGAEEKFALATATIQMAVDNMKSFVKAVKQAAERDALTERITLPERLAGKSGVDRLIIIMGNSMIKWFGFGVVGAKVGNYVLQAASILRIGVTPADTVGLVKDAMKYDPTIKDRFDTYYKPLRARGIGADKAYFTALAQVQSEEKAIDLIKQKELHLTYTNQKEKANFSIKITGLIAIFQIASLICSVAKSDKTGDDYALIVINGLATASVLLQVPSDSLKANFGNSTKFAILNIKAMSGFFGAASAIISLGIDLGKRATDTKANPAAGLVFIIKIGFTAWTTAATIITAFCYAAPYLASIVKPERIAFLARANMTMALASAEAVTAKTLAGSAGKALTDVEKKDAIARAGKSAARIAVAQLGVQIVSVEGAELLVVRLALFAAGWEIVAAITIVEFVYKYLKNNDLQKWIIECPFGTSPKNPKDNIKISRDSFEKSLATSR